MPDSAPWRSRSQVSASVPIDDVGPAARGALAHARAVGGAADLPGVAHVAQAHVVGGVEAGLGARGSARERAEGLSDLAPSSVGTGTARYATAAHGHAPLAR